MRNYRWYLLLALVVLSATLLVNLQAQFSGPAVNQWTATADLTSPRADACSVTLNDGRILVAGGQTDLGPVNTVEFYRSNGTVAAGTPMLAPRAGAACATMADGRVLVTGGVTSGTGAPTLASGELFDPSNNTWQPVESMLVGRTGHSATLLPWGAVLITGGSINGIPSDLVEVYDTALHRITVGHLSSARTNYAIAALAASHTVVIAGGVTADGTASDVDIYNALNDTVAHGGQMLAARRNFAATPMLDGTVMFIGGYGADGQALASTEIFDAATGDSQPGPDLSWPRAEHQGFLLPNNGSILVVGGTDGAALLTSSETFSVPTGKFSPASALHIGRTGMASALMKPGAIMIAGGRNQSGYVAGTEAYAFATVTTDKPDYHPGEIATITGTGWKSGENVQVKIAAYPVDQHNVEFTGSAVADGSGRIHIGGFNIDKSHLGVKFLLTAVGSQSTAQVTFTDATNTFTTLTVTPGASPQAYGTSTTFTGTVCTSNATCSAPGLADNTSVSIKFNGVTIAQVPDATMSTDGVNQVNDYATQSSNIPPGSYAIKAVYNGDTNFNSSTSATWTPNPYVVDGIGTTVTLSSNAIGTPAFGTPVNFTATVSGGATTPTGSVTFSDAVQGLLGTVAVNGSGTATLQMNNVGIFANLLPGFTHTVTASFTGTGGFDNSSGTTNYNVTQLTTSPFTISAASFSGAAYAPVVFTVSATKVAGFLPAGTIVLNIDNGATYSSSGALGVGGTVTFSVPAGTISMSPSSSHTVNLNYTQTSGSDPWATMTAVSGKTYTTSLATTSTTISSNPTSPQQYGTSVIFTAQVGETGNSSGGNLSGGTVNFCLDSNPTCGSPTTGALASVGSTYQATYTPPLLTVGTHHVDAKYVGDTNNATSTATQASYVISKATSAVGLTPSNTTINIGNSVTFTANVTLTPSGAGNPAGSVQLYDTSGPTAIGTTCTVANFSSNTGSCQVTINYNSTGVQGQGTHSVYAVYTPTDTTDIANGTSGNSTVTVNATGVTISNLAKAGTTTYGNAITLTASVCPTGSAPPCNWNPNTTGTVTFLDGATSHTVDSFDQTTGTATLVLDGTTANKAFLTGGSHTITAQFTPGADTKYSAASSSNLIFSITPATPTFGATVTPSSVSIAYGGTFPALSFTVNLAATGAAAPTGTFTITQGTTQIGGTYNISVGSTSVTPVPTAIGVGNNKTVALNYSGDTNYAAGVDTLTNYLSISQATATCTTLTSSSPLVSGNPTSAAGANVTFTATCTGPTGTTPTGTIEFLDGGNPITGTAATSTVTMTNGAATFSTALLTTGSHTISATYSGDTNFTGPVTFPSLTQVVSPGTTTITLGTSAQNVAVGGSITYTVTVTMPTGSATPFTGTFSVNDATSSQNCTPTMSGAGLTQTGTCSITYSNSFPGNHSVTAGYITGDPTKWANATSSSQTITVGLASITLGTLAVAGSPATYGSEDVVLTVPVTPTSPSPVLGANVIFTDTFNNTTTNLSGSYSFSAGTAQLIITGVGLAAGSHTITAKYPGDSNYSASNTTNNVIVTVTQFNITGANLKLSPTEGTASAGTANYAGTISSSPGQVSFTGLPAGGATPTGTISIIVNGNPGNVTIATPTITGAGTVSFNGLNLPATVIGGNHTMTFTYNGDSNYNTGSKTTTATNYLVVNQISATCNLTSSSNPSAVGANVTFTATCTGPTGTTPSGTITFLDNNVSIGTGSMTGGIATFTTAALSAGSHPMSITYGGDTNFQATPLNGTTTLTQTVSTSATSVTLSPSAGSVAIGGSVTYTVTVQVPTGSATPINNTNPNNSVVVTDSTSGQTCQPGVTAGSTAMTGAGTSQTGSCSITYTTNIGQHSVSAGFTSTDTTKWQNGTSATVTVTVGTTATTTTISTSSAGSSYGYPTSTTLSGSVAPNAPGSFSTTPINGAATLKLYDGGSTLLGTASLTTNTGAFSLASVVLGPGTHNITAQFSGDSNYSASTSTIFTITVNKTPFDPINSITLNPAGVYSASVSYGTPVAGTATVATAPGGSVPTGTITVKICTESTCTSGIVVNLGTFAMNAAGTANWSGTLPASLVPGTYYGYFSYSGDNNYAGGADPGGYWPIVKAGSTCALTTNGTPTASGTTVTFKVTCSTTVSGGAGIPSGAVTISDSLGSFSTQNLTLNSQGVALYQTAALSAGSHNITATYAGDTNFNATTPLPNPLVQVVTATSTGIALNPSSLSISVGGSETYTVTVTVPVNSAALTGGEVKVFDALQPATPICDLNPPTWSGGPTIYTASCPALNYNGAAGSLFGSGSHTLNAQFTSGNTANWASCNSGNSCASANVTVNVGGTTTTTTFTGPGGGSSATTGYAYGTLTNLQATVTPASGAFSTVATSGTVSFYDNATLIPGTVAFVSNGSGVATLSNVLLQAGSHIITAQFSGDTNYSASTALNLNIAVSKADPVVSVAPSSISVPYGSSLPASGDTLTLGAVTNGTTPTGTASVMADSTTLASSVALVGGAVPFNSLAVPGSLAVGAHTISFNYSGDRNYNAKTPVTPTVTLNLTQLTPVCTLTSSSNPSAQNAPVTFTATCTAPSTSPNALSASGTMTFKDGGTAISGAVTMAAGSAAFTATSLTPGNHTITASYSGDTNYAANAAIALTGTPQVVNAGTTVVSVAASTTTPAMGTSVTYTVTVTVPNGVPTPQGSVAVNDVTGTSTTLCTVASLTGSSNQATGSCNVLYDGSSTVKGSGAHQISALYTSGDTTKWSGGTSPVILVTAGLKSTTISAVTPVCIQTCNSPTSITYPTALTFSATVSPNGASQSPAYTGVVQFVDTTGGSSTVIGTAVPNTTTGVATIPASGGIILTGGSHSITAQFVGDSNYSQSSLSTTLVVNVASSTPTVTIVGSPFNVPLGGTLTISTITVQGITGQSVPAGTVTLCSGSTNLTTCAGAINIGTASFVSNNASTATATYSFSGTLPLTVLPGANNLLAVFTSSNNNYVSANSPDASLIVGKTTSTTSVVSSVNPSVVGQTVIFTATVTPTGFGAAPTGTVVFSVNGTQVCTATLSASGAVATASASNNPSSSSICTIPPLIKGGNSVVAAYSGDTNYQASTSATTGSGLLVQTVNQAATSTALTSTSNSSVVGQPGVVLTAYVSVNAPGSSTSTQTPSGSVTFFNTIAGVPQNMGTATLQPGPAGSTNTWQATCNTGTSTCTSLPQGQLSLTAVYSGDGNFVTSTSNTLTQAVNKPTVTVNTLPNANPVIYGTSVTFTSTVTPNPPGTGTPTGNLVFTDGGTVLATVALVGGQATYTVLLTPGNHSIGVQYSGDANYQGYIENAIAELVNQIPSSISLAPSQSAGVPGQAITLVAQINPNAPAGVPFPSGSIEFDSNGEAIGTAPLASGIASITTTALPVGLNEIQAIYRGDSGWAATSSAFQPVVISAAQTITTVASSTNPSVFGQQVNFTIVVSAVVAGSNVPAQGQVQLFDNAVGLGTPITINNGQTTIPVSTLSPGTHNITATFIGNTNFNTSQSQSLSQTVNKAPTVTTLASLPNTSTSNQSVTLTAVVTVPTPGSGIPTGTVTFSDSSSGNTLGSGPLTVVGGVLTASINTTALNQAGAPRLLVATYSGDANFSASASSPQPQTVFGTQVAVVNSESGQSSNFAPGSLASVYGTNLAGTSLASQTQPVPTSLAGTTVTITDSAGVSRQAGLYYVSGNQINLVIPDGTAFGLATLTVNNGNNAAGSAVILITYTAPGILTANQSGQGVAQAQVLDVTPDGSQSYINTFQYDSTSNAWVANPVTMNANDSYYLILYGTGFRGATAGQVTASVGGKKATVLYAGPQPQFQGLDQVNLQIPAGLVGAGSVNVIVTVNGQAANTVTVTFQ